MNKNPQLTLKMIGARWQVSPRTARRTLIGHNRPGKKFGCGHSASVRYSEEDVSEVERLAAKQKFAKCSNGKRDQPNLTLREIATRWHMHRTTARRRLDHYGREAKKFGKARSASVRYSLQDVEEVERFAES